MDLSIVIHTREISKKLLQEYEVYQYFQGGF